MAKSVKAAMDQYTGSNPSPDQINTKVPLVNDTSRLRNMEDFSKVTSVPLYQCDGCQCFYALHDDFEGAANTVGGEYAGAPLEG